MTVSREDEQRIKAFLDKSLTPENIKKAFDAAQSGNTKDTFIPIAKSPYDPIRISSRAMTMSEPYVTTYALRHIWESQTGRDYAALFKQEYNHDLAISIDLDPTNGRGVTLGMQFPENQKTPRWKKLLHLG